MLALATDTIEKSLQNSFDYNNYRQLVKTLLANGLSTGPIQNENLFNFSILNNKRMDRLDKTLHIFDEFKDDLNSLSEKITLLVISEGWCGDAAQTLPILNKLAESSNKIDLKIVLRDENEELMELFLTNGSKSIPKVILLDNNNNVLNTWGPRTQIATHMVHEYKAKYGSVDAELKKQLQLWYNKDKGYNTQLEIINLLKNSTINYL